jgi:hypothetical protein
MRSLIGQNPEDVVFREMRKPFKSFKIHPVTDADGFAATNSKLMFYMAISTRSTVLAGAPLKRA